MLLLEGDLGGFGAEQFPKRWMHFAVASLPLLPTAQGAVD
jgi:hypothetical protein